MRQPGCIDTKNLYDYMSRFIFWVDDELAPDS